MQALLPPGWPAPRGYANGVVAQGRQVFVAGMVGWDEQGMFRSDDFVDQAAQALRNVLAVLREGGAGPEHLVRLTWYITDKPAYLAGAKRLGQVYRDLIGSYTVAMSAVVVAALIEDRAKVEIEATAVVPDAPAVPARP